MGPPYSLAILDDYASIAPKHFHPLLSANLLKTVDAFPHTLDPATPSGLETLVRRLQDYDIVSTMRERTPFPAALLQRLPKLKLLLTTSARNASFDLDVAKERGVIVAGTKGSAPPDAETWTDLPPDGKWTGVNQHAWALLLALCSRIAVDDAALKCPASPTSWQSGLAVPLGGKTLGVLGLGKLGALMARTGALGFGMTVVCWSSSLTQERADEAAEKHGCERGSWRVVASKDALMREADVLSLHYVLSPRSRHIVSARELALMKPSAILVNTSRGPLVEEGALVEALREGRIRGAALDVFDAEPLPAGSVWRGSGGWKAQVVLSPHMGYANAGTMERWYQEQAEEVGRWGSGEEVRNRMN